MAELLPPEFPLDAPTTTSTTTTTNAATPAILQASVDTTNNSNLGPSLAPKRQRRPSVRLGEIGDQPAATLSYDSHAPGRPKPWRLYKHPALLVPSNKSSKTTTRPLTNLVVNSHQILDAADVNLDFGHHKPKSKRATAITTAKRVRTNWTTAAMSNDNNNGSRIEGESNTKDKEELIREFEPEIEEGSGKEQSPVQSVDNVGLNYWGRNGGRVRVSDNGGVPETSGDRNFGGGGSERGLNRDRCNGFLDDGVRNWLVGLGLGRYAAVFVIHEVDDQVLPLLTLEDLKDMGINAVGSRRKLCSAIQKLPKGFS
ncbi:hypothetical protein RHGRI_034090 [Rhododendron griersonianum]|uniref:SAM domain-containing protein n=1 Tax=Rhododendron griersonianum TaxID=479676 RepID=A0AAV6I021_9ERIC|nr:hypothetical protein RHGRI_034090 [Rhododendron griersonianum]